MKIKILLFCVLALSACGQGSDGQAVDTTLTVESQMVWPKLEAVDPAPAIIGEKLTIVGIGGYQQFETEAGIGYDESFRTFQLFLDGEEFGEIGCTVNRCEGEIIIPAELESGEYELSVEGGSKITLHLLQPEQ